MTLQYDGLLGNRANYVEPDRIVAFGEQSGLAAGLFQPETDAGAVLIFYHGGGANMGGYGGMADLIRRSAAITVLTPDIRGHGKSSGPRGFAARPETVWGDVEAAIGWAMENVPGVPIFVGGHSSGAGMVINWADHRAATSPPVAGLLLLAPFVGTRLQKPGTADSFARARTWVFLVYLLSGMRLMAGAAAVRFNYPAGRVEFGNLVQAYAPGMAMAVTPRDALAALRRISTPLLIIAAADDELLDTERLRGVAPHSSFVTVAGTHLSCFLAAAAPVAAFVSGHT